MKRSKLIVTPFAALVLVLIGASVPATVVDGATVAALSSEPCAPDLAPAPRTTSEPKPRAPDNLRILGDGGTLGGGGTDEEFLEPEFAVTSGPYAWPEVMEAASASGSHAYFDMLVNRPDCMTSFHFRTQANIDLVRSRSVNDRKRPIIYDPSSDGALFEIDPSGSLPSSGSTGTPQKRLPIHVQGQTSLLITWDLKIAKSMRYVAPDGLGQHKSHRLDDRGADSWVGMKQNYRRATNQEKGIAMFFFSAQPKYMGTGTTRGSSETITPVLGEFYIQPNTWTRVWVFVEGNIGVADNDVQMSVWLADENRAPVQLYNRVNMITPPDGIGLFRYEFDSSTEKASNGPGQQWQRNFVALKGVTRAAVAGLLQKPVK